MFTHHASILKYTLQKEDKHYDTYNIKSWYNNMFTNSTENKPSDKPANAKPIGETQSSRDENNYNTIDKLLDV